jgi:hypothetical protein
MKARLVCVGLLLAIMSGTLLAGQTGSLHVRKVHYLLDETGQAWVVVHLINDGNSVVTVNAIAPSQSGPWASVGQALQPGGTVRGQLKASDSGPAVVWVASSQGLLQFELPARH